MKKKIGEINRTPIVTGDKNLVAKNEIHKSELSDSFQLGGGNSINEYYYRFYAVKFCETIGITEDNFEEKKGEIELYLLNPNKAIINENSDGYDYKVECQDYLSSFWYFTRTLALSYSDANPMIGYSRYSGSIQYVGDYRTRCINCLGGMDEDAAKQILDMIEPCLTQITKQEYEALMSVPVTIIK